MTRLTELKERRAAALETMRAHEEAGGAEFDTAKAQYDSIAAQITRAEAIESAERQERGKPLVGDGKLETELRQFSIRRAIAGAAGMEGVDSFLGTMGVKEAAMKTRDGTGLPISMEQLFHMEPRAFSNQVPNNLGDDDDEHGLIYGDWSELLIGVWSEIDILVNPYESAAYKKGNISLRAIATVDTACRHPQAFVSATGYKP